MDQDQQVESHGDRRQSRRPSGIIAAFNLQTRHSVSFNTPTLDKTDTTKSSTKPKMSVSFFQDDKKDDASATTCETIPGKDDEGVTFVGVPNWKSASKGSSKDFKDMLDSLPSIKRRMSSWARKTVDNSKDITQHRLNMIQANSRRVSEMIDQETMGRASSVLDKMRGMVSRSVEGRDLVDDIKSIRGHTR